MKKLLTVSLVAVMAVSAAHADLASTAYVNAAVNPVDEKVGNAEFTAGSIIAGAGDLTAAANTLAQEVANVKGGAIKLTAASAGDNVTIDTDGKINVAKGTQTSLGVLKGGTGVTITDGAINVDSQVAGLNFDAAAVDGSYVSTVAQVDGQVSQQLVAFDGKIEKDAQGKYTSKNAPSSAAVADFVNTAITVFDENQGDLKRTVAQHTSDIANLGAGLAEAQDDIGLAKDQTGAVTSFSTTNYLKEATTLTGAAVELDDKINDLFEDKQDKLSATNVTSTGDGVVKTVVGADGKLTVTKAQVLEADIADTNVTKAKLSNEVQASLGLADGSLQKSTLEDASIRKAAEQGDGQYALTMKVENGVIAYQWDLISY